MNYEENNIVFGEINLSDKKFSIVDIINLDEELHLNEEFSHINSIPQEFGTLLNAEEDTVYYKLNELDTTGVEPMSHVFPVNNVFREDVVTNGDGSKETLSNAPAQKDGGFKVPKTIGD